MTEPIKRTLIEKLQELNGETVLRLILDFHGEQLLTTEFAEHCVEEGAVDADGLGLDDEDDDECEAEEGE